MKRFSHAIAVTLLTIVFSFEVLPLAYDTSNYNVDYCVNCSQYISPSTTMAINPNFGYMPPFYSPYQMPWWGPYGMYRYSNFLYPGPWNGGWIDQTPYPIEQYPRYPKSPSPYPSTPPAAVALKPNIYIETPAGEMFKLTLKLDARSKLLASAPPMSRELYIKKTSDGKLQIDGASYSYLYYDFKLTTEELQSENGFCSTPKELLTKMADILHQHKFKENEIRDFYQHWVMKIPKSEYYCVFPQSDNEIKKYTQLITDKKFEVERVYFLVIPKTELSEQQTTKFHRLPIKDWNRPLTSEDSNYKIREWAVLFL